MPPKRKTRAAGASAVSASQPEPQRPQTRTSTRKRRHSDGSDVSSSQASKTNGVMKTAAKRGRPKKTTLDAEVILEENETGDEVMVEPARTKPSCDQDHNTESDVSEMQDDDENNSVQVSQSSTKHVHFGSDDDTLVEKSTATYITPHPTTKMTIKRRRTVTPSEEGSVKRLKNTRTSLPASLSQEEPTQIIQELRFAPLRKILDDRIRRQSELKGDTAERGYDLPMSEDEMLVLDQAEEFSIAQLPTGLETPSSSADHVLKGTAATPDSKEPVTPGAHDRAAWNAERKNYQDAIVALEDEADKARTRLRILEMELDALDFGEHGTTSLHILQSIRESFAQVREFLEKELPGSLPESASNEDLVEILVANVKEFADRLRTADKELGEKGHLVNDLGGQVNGLLDRLARREIDSAKLLDRVTQLDGSVVDRDRDIAALEEDLRDTKEERDRKEKARDDEAAKADRFEIEKSELEKNIERLSASLQKYHSEETRLTDKINKMEEEHRATVSAMNKEREGTVRDLEDQLDEETKQHEEAAKLADERHSAIKELERRIKEAEEERNDLQQELETLAKERKDEQAAREHLESTLEDKNNEVNDLETRVRRLEDELDDYSEQLDELRHLSDNERTQRGAAEHDLDVRNAKIGELNEKLTEQGKQANELRQKLFEVQTKNAEKIKELENAASERDLQYQEDMAVEVERRGAAEGLAQERAAIILALEQELEEVEQEMHQLLAKKDEEIDALKDEVEQKNAEIQNLNETLREDATAYATELKQKRTRIKNLENNTTELQQTIADHEGTIESLSQQVIDAEQTHALQLEERDAQITILNDQLTSLNVQKDSLEAQRTILERKVEHEAENMLTMQNETAAEIETLKDAIRTKQQKIQAVEDKVRETDRYWEAVLAAREEQIQTLAATTERQTETIDRLKSRFGEYVRRSSGFITDLQERVEGTRVYVEEEGSTLREEGKGLLGEILGLEDTGPHKKGAKAMGKKRRQFDSGVGLSVGPGSLGNGSVSPTGQGAALVEFS